MRYLVIKKDPKTETIYHLTINGLEQLAEHLVATAKATDQIIISVILIQDDTK
jgi:hypothetical protein